jgi:hypothetical protein
MIGGFSPGRVFGPVVGTSDGSDGCGGPGGPLSMPVSGVEDPGVVDSGVVDSGVVDSGVVDTGGESPVEAGPVGDVFGGGLMGADVLGDGPTDDDVQAVPNSITPAVAYAVNARIRPTAALCPNQPRPATIRSRPVDAAGGLRRWRTARSQWAGNRRDGV